MGFLFLLSFDAFSFVLFLARCCLSIGVRRRNFSSGTIRLGFFWIPFEDGPGASSFLADNTTGSKYTLDQAKREGGNVCSSSLSAGGFPPASTESRRPCDVQGCIPARGSRFEFSFVTFFRVRRF